MWAVVPDERVVVVWFGVSGWCWGGVVEGGEGFRWSEGTFNMMDQMRDQNSTGGILCADTMPRFRISEV
jgi:hypothetical protein